MKNNRIFNFKYSKSVQGDFRSKYEKKNRIHQLFVACMRMSALSGFLCYILSIMFDPPVSLTLSLLFSRQ